MYKSNFIINLTSSQYYEIRNLVSDTSVEAFVLLGAKLIGNNIYPNNFEIFTKDMIESASKSHLKIKTKYLTSRIAYNKVNGNNVLITMHTHPNFMSATQMSEADKKTLKNNQEILKNPILNMLCIEGIITKRGVNFYIYNHSKLEFARVDCLVDGVLLSDPDKRGLVEAFKNGLSMVKRKCLKIK